MRLRMIHTAFVAMIYGFLYVPLVILMVYSFNAAAFPAPWTGFTLEWYGELFQSTHIWQAFLNSLIVAISATTLSIIFSILLVFYDVKGGSVERYMPLFYANLIVPEIVLSVGLLGLFVSFSIPLGLLTLSIAHSILGVGYTIPMVYERYKELDYRLFEASLDLGATRKQTFFTIILPLLRQSIATSAIMTFVISFDDFVLAYFCAGGESQTLPLYILSVLRAGVSPVINALATCILLASGLFVMVYTIVTKKRIQLV